MHSKKSEKLLDYLSNTYFQVGLLGGLLILYLLTHFSIFAILTVVILLIFVGYEFYSGMKEHGWRTELKEIIITILVVVIFWEALILLLGTNTPISGIATCSMKPNMNRGDLILLRMEKVNAPTIYLSKSDISEITPEFTVGNLTSNGSLFNLCVQSVKTSICTDFVKNPQNYHESHGPITFNYGKCNIYVNDKLYETPCVLSVGFKGKIFPMMIKRDIIAYRPKKSDIFSRVGDISHRVQLILKADNVTYYLTKGDNNEIFDLQMYDYNLKEGNSLINHSQLKGRVIYTIPYIGYYKLFLSGMFGDVPQCHTRLITPNFE